MMDNAKVKEIQDLAKFLGEAEVSFDPALEPRVIKLTDGTLCVVSKNFTMEEEDAST